MPVCVGRGCGWAFQGLCLANRVVERRLTNCAAGSTRLAEAEAEAEVAPTAGTANLKWRLNSKVLLNFIAYAEVQEQLQLERGGVGGGGEALSRRHLHMQPQARPAWQMQS